MNKAILNKFFDLINRVQFISTTMKLNLFSNNENNIILNVNIDKNNNNVIKDFYYSKS